MLNDTLFGFKTLAESTTDRNLVLWINQYFGPVTPDQKRDKVDHRYKRLIGFSALTSMFTAANLRWSGSCMHFAA